MTIERARQQQCKRDRDRDRERESERQVAGVMRACWQPFKRLAPYNSITKMMMMMMTMYHAWSINSFSSAAAAAAAASRAQPEAAAAARIENWTESPAWLSFLHFGLGWICIFPPPSAPPSSSLFFNIFFVFFSLEPTLHLACSTQHSRAAQRSVAFIASSVFLGALLFSPSAPPPLLFLLLLLLQLVVFFTYAHYQVACSFLTDCSDEAGERSCLRARELAN